jgi:hypothetical protein
MSLGVRRGIDERGLTRPSDVDDEMEAPTLLDILGGDHVEPLVDDLADRERAELNGEGGHIVVADDVFIAHFDRK